MHDSYMIEINVNSDEESMRELYGIRRKKTRLMAFSPEWWLKFPGHMALAYRNGGSFWTGIFTLPYIINMFLVRMLTHSPTNPVGKEKPASYLAVLIFTYPIFSN